MTDYNERVDQIRRAHRSAKPTPHNLSWRNCHHDCGVLLDAIAQLTRERDAAVNDAARWRMNVRMMLRKHSRQSVDEVVAVVDAAISASNQEVAK